MWVIYYKISKFTSSLEKIGTKFSLIFVVLFYKQSGMFLNFTYPLLNVGLNKKFQTPLLWNLTPEWPLSNFVCHVLFSWGAPNLMDFGCFTSFFLTWIGQYAMQYKGLEWPSKSWIKNSSKPHSVQYILIHCVKQLCKKCKFKARKSLLMS